MRNTLALLAAGVLAFAGLGWYLGWYHIKTTPTSDGHQTINVDVDTKKITEDVGKEIKQGEEYLKQHKPGTTQVTTPTGQSRFRVENGVVIDTEGVSTPTPIGH
jgi:hypothetical protein